MRITDYPAKAVPATDDLVLLVDVHDASQSPQGSVKVATAASVAALSAGGVTSVSAADGSAVVTPATGAVTVRTGSLDAVAAARPPAAAVGMNGQKITALANGSAASDAAAFGQTPAGGSTVTIAQGGTGATAQQAALDAIAGATSSGQYLRGNGTHVAMSAIPAADVPQLASYAPTGLTGATAASRYVGATASGPPVSGTFAVGDFEIDQSGKVWVCTTAGSPGTWTQAGGASSPANAVAIATAGSTFSPKVALVAGSTATVSWTCPAMPSVNTTGLTPTLNFGTAAARIVYMTAVDANGYNALGDVTLFNIGFNNQDDNGQSSLPSSYNWTSQAVTGVSGITNLRGLVYFLAADIFTANAGANLTGTLDFSGLDQLQYIEMYSSRATNVFIGGCTSLVRLCVEFNNLTSLNINPAQPSLLDLRAAAQGPAGAQPATTPLNFTPLAIPAKSQWHYCIRDQVVTNIADLSLLTAVQQLWIWNTRQSGLLKTYSTQLGSLIAHGNDYTSADLTGQFGPNASLLGSAILDLAANLLTSVNLTGCTNLITAQLQDNNLPQAQVDAVLAQLDANGQNNGTVYLTGNAAPSAAGSAHATNLTGRGWTVATGPTGAITVVQTATSTGSLPLSFASPVTAGNTVVLITGGYNTVGGATSSAPTLGGSAVTGSYSAVPITGNGILAGPVAGNYAYIAAWVLPNCPSANSLNLTRSGFSPTGCIAFEIHGLGATPSGGGAGATGGHTAVDPTGCAFQAGGQQTIVIGLAQIYAQAASGPAAPWTNINGSGASSGNSPTWAGYRFQTQAQGKSYHWLQTAVSDNNPWAAALFGIHA